MINLAGIEHCQSFINCQLDPDKASQRLHRQSVRSAVTLSRQAGCGALVVAQKLAALLQPDLPPDDPPWTVFDRNLMDKVLEDHNLPARLAKFLPEDRATELQDITDEFFGLRPASWTMIQQTSETVLKLAELGNVILIGRAANIITAKLPHVVHVKLIAPLEARLKHCQESYDMTAWAAREFCQREDEGRRRYLKKYFHADVDDALLYDLTINTGAVSFDTAAALIANTVRAKVKPAGKSR
ncbi:MAG: cytidylate kinase-like family protein [Verrucomicrobiota bacterium]